MTRPTRLPRTLPALLLILALTTGLGADSAFAANTKEIDISVDVALKDFRENVTGAERYLGIAKGVLVFPKVVKAGLIHLGGEYGEGALRVGGKTVEYYNTAAASIGFQLGAQVKTALLVFLDSEALAAFRAGDGWEVGVEGSIFLSAGPEERQTEFRKRFSRDILPP